MHFAATDARGDAKERPGTAGSCFLANGYLQCPGAPAPTRTTTSQNKQEGDSVVVLVYYSNPTHDAVHLRCAGEDAFAVAAHLQPSVIS